MSQTITIDPVTRIEGHSKITIQLDDRGEVTDAHFHVTQFRGFERITQGRPVNEMPALMARICGICPVSHLVASSKAVDDIMAVEPTPTGADLRRVINLGQIVREVERCAAGQALVLGAHRAGGDILEPEHVLDVIRLAAGRISPDEVRAPGHRSPSQKAAPIEE